MCEFCVKHGEGKKWYLNVKNYSHDLLSDINRKKFVGDHWNWINRNYGKYSKLIETLSLRIPFTRPVLNAVIKRIFLYEHWSQVIPIEDIERILEFTNSITRVPCVCRKILKGKEHRLCFLISLYSRQLGIAEIIDQSYFGGPDVTKFEGVNKEWTLNFMKECETRGMIHTIWAIKAPFVGILCNCDLSSGCIPMKMIKDKTPFTFRAEYVAEVSPDLCIGCKKCMKLCQFDAMEFNSKLKKTKIDPKKCHGCGICRIECSTKAITLKDRKLVAAVANIW